MKFYKEADFMNNGYRCIVLFIYSGHRTAYVGIPESHPLYKQKYGEESPLLSFDAIKDQQQGKRGIIPLVCFAFSSKNEEDGVRPDVFFDVHGSITYSDFHQEWTEENDTRWYFGFDCGHAGDANDYRTALRHGLISEEHYKYMVSLYERFGVDGEVRSLQYCIEECEHLAEQLYLIEKANKQ